jgi:Protein of unknown function (DUF2500).
MKKIIRATIATEIGILSIRIFVPAIAIVVGVLALVVLPRPLDRVEILCIFVVIIIPLIPVLINIKWVIHKKSEYVKVKKKRVERRFNRRRNRYDYFYYVVFEFPDSSALEFPVFSVKVYDAISEGDTGKFTYRGKRKGGYFVSLEKDF